MVFLIILFDFLKCPNKAIKNKINFFINFVCCPFKGMADYHLYFFIKWNFWVIVPKKRSYFFLFSEFFSYKKKNKMLLSQLLVKRKKNNKTNKHHSLSQIFKIRIEETSKNIIDV
ncbi:hypothetical protein BpHYR1_030382 [Brachionus plicatilis]|uniref:Uncharacterized protein n=1 Tax=Brachionus plicatilis TaxID=10195 RepID=A0A3M7SHZ3_BRAPC|nr:hypothetical protein BpHYR1_030382 [Brachionus plicatilis]